MEKKQEKEQPAIGDKLRQWMAPILAGIVIFTINKIDKKLEQVFSVINRSDSTNMRQNIRLDYIERKQQEIENRYENDHEKIEAVKNSQYRTTRDEIKENQKPKKK